MTMTDPIADMLTRLRNANIAFHDDVADAVVEAEGSARAASSSSEGYITGFDGRATTPTRPGQPADDRDEVHARPQAHDLRPAARLEARPARVLEGRRDVPRVLGGMGIAILSTNQGLMTDREARQRRVGGEVLCQVW